MQGLQADGHAPCLVAQCIVQPKRLQYGASVPNLTLKNLPRDLHRSLKNRAARHGRSLNSEAIACLQSVLGTETVDVDALIVRARAHRASIGKRLDDGAIRAMKRAGRG